MGKRKRDATPLVAVIQGWGVDGCFLSADAEVVSIDTRAEVDWALTHADAIVLTGGSDVNPSRYGAEKGPTTYGIDKERDALEFYAADKARAKGIPLMGICRGMQLLNVAHGGTLIQEINDKRTVHKHWGQKHGVKYLRGSTIGRLLARHGISLNGQSYHHQAIDRVGEGLRPVGWAYDGTIEMIESAPGVTPYVFGTQFHPEMEWSDKGSELIFEHFVRAASVKARGRRRSAVERWNMYDDAFPRWKKYLKKSDTLAVLDSDGSYQSPLECEAEEGWSPKVGGGEHGKPSTTTGKATRPGGMGGTDIMTRQERWDAECAFPPCGNTLACDPTQAKGCAHAVAALKRQRKDTGLFANPVPTWMEGHK